MDFVISDQAREYLNEKDQKEFFIDVLLRQEGCCSAPMLSGVFHKNATKGRAYQTREVDGIAIHYDPFLFEYVPDGEIAEIGLTGLGPFRSLYLKTRLNPFKEFNFSGEDYGSGK